MDYVKNQDDYVRHNAALRRNRETLVKMADPSFTLEISDERRRQAADWALREIANLNAIIPCLEAGVIIERELFSWVETHVFKIEVTAGGEPTYGGPAWDVIGHEDGREFHARGWHLRDAICRAKIAQAAVRGLALAGESDVQEMSDGVL